MRAIIKCTISTKPEDLDKVLEERDWLPTLDAANDEIQYRKNDIIEHIAFDDRALAIQTFRNVIYDEETKTWGYVNNPAGRVITVRLKNANSDRLKRAVEKLITDLQSPASHLIGGGSGPEFAFKDDIEVLEPNSDSRAYTGRILEPRRFRVAVQERKREAMLFFVTFLFAVFSLLITTPLFFGSSNPAPQGTWLHWMLGNMERFSTAALVTAAVSLMEVLLHWFDIRRKSLVRWTVD